ncbi:MAG TPA: hypothetical protein PLD20_31135 [Blastocatellia bacterium]|nr:hypothetical protein [Blastocatellia bacterium]HMV84201.1 hypothetical protein [Blastocatellia bacterium]HMX30254.1 hypothetical protein [Blastocatellia bacterium]HMZ22426.1 hypothetical protein [Blastocatellia bacterium]HNG33420.1 hypothetical protein [Blastocatellia bacterium]
MKSTSSRKAAKPQREKEERDLGSLFFLPVFAALSEILICTSFNYLPLLVEIPLFR